MSVKELGTKIYARSSWGRKQIKEAFGYELIKTTYGATELAKIAWEIESEIVGFGSGSALVSVIDTYFTNGGPNLGYKSYIFCLKAIWDQSVIELEHNSTPEEFSFAKRLFNRMKSQCVEDTTIGKNQIIKALYIHALDLLDHI